MTTPTLDQAIEELVNLGLDDPHEITARLLSEHDAGWLFEQTNARKILVQRITAELRRLDQARDVG